MNQCALVAGFDPAKATLTLNRWIAASLAATTARVVAAFEEYKFNDAADALYHFAWHSFCDWYLEFSKPVLLGNDAAAKAETRAMTAWVLGRIVHLLHPIMPFLTEVLWKHLAGDKAGMLIAASWPSDIGGADKAAMAEMDWVIALISAIRTARAEMNVPGANEIDAYVTEAGGEQKEYLARHGDPIRRLARLKKLGSVADKASATENSIQVVVENASLLLDLAGAVDLGKERARLKKESETVRGELDKIAVKLGNPQFIAKAKPEAIDEQREREAQGRAALARLDAALARLGGA
jgi:valyl-tRNA synthetase